MKKKVKITSVIVVALELIITLAGMKFETEIGLFLSEALFYNFLNQ